MTRTAAVLADHTRVIRHVTITGVEIVLDSIAPGVGADKDKGMDYQIEHWLGRWEISAYDYAAPVGYEQTTIARFDSEAACYAAWDMVLEAENEGRKL